MLTRPEQLEDHHVQIQDVQIVTTRDHDARHDEDLSLVHRR